MVVGSSCAGCTDPPAVGNNGAHECDVDPCKDPGPGDAGTNHDVAQTNNGAPQVVSIHIDPPSATLVAADGATPTQQFTAIAEYDDGSRAPYRGAEFSLDTEAMGRIDAANGLFTANGVIGGTAYVTATPVDPTVTPTLAQATITVQIERTVFGEGAPVDAAAKFAAPAEDPTYAASIVYPLEGAVMPQNVYPADIQWLNGAPDDLFRVTVSKPSARVTAYVLHSGAGFGNHWLADVDGWRSLAQTEPDLEATITVDRWVAAQQAAYSTPPVHVRFARAALSGTVYYWDIGAGRIVRIDDGTGQGVRFMPTPPPDETGMQCVGCHSVSNSGQYMVGRLGGGNNVGAVFDLTQDLSGNPPPTVWPLDPVNGPRWWFSSWSPNDDRIVVSRVEPNGGLELMDPFTGQTITPAAGALPTDHVTHPSWAPDGSLIAYVSGTNAWGGAHTSGDLSVIPVTGPDSFGAAQVLISGASVQGGSTISYPTWTPDAQRIAFAHGTGGRSETDQASLHIVDRDGNNLVRLDRANGGAGTTDNFQPNFSPFDQGGYFWMMFLSRRDYGNAEVGTRGSGRQQLWVTAIGKQGAGGDPSQVPYWLPGQDTQSMNIAGYWAPRPCRDDGATCSVGTECCSGTCAPDANGDLVCSPPPPDRCREKNETCSTTQDCCAGKDLICIDNVCQNVVN